MFKAVFYNINDVLCHICILWKMFVFPGLMNTVIFLRHGTACVGNICSLVHIFQIARASPVHGPLRITPQMLHCIQVWAVAMPLQNSNLLLVLFLCSFLTEVRKINWHWEAFIASTAFTVGRFSLGDVPC